MKFDNYLLRPISKKDALAYYTLVQINKEHLMLYFPTTLSANSSLISTSSYITTCCKRMKKKEFYIYLICDTQENYKIIGAVFIKDIDWNIPKSELGFFIDETYQGKGIVSKAVSYIIKFCFEELHLTKLIIRSAVNNKASRKVAENNHFLLEGIIRKDIKTYDGTIVDVAFYGLLKNIEKKSIIV